MIKEVIRPNSEYLNIKVPQEYIGKELEILIFSDNEVIKRKKESKKEELLKEFKKISKNRIKPKIKYYLKMEDEVNDDIF